MTRLALVLALAPLPALAHPHSYVDQQVALSLGLDRAEVEVRILPSAADGPAIFDHVDTDGDGAVSEAEAQAFASAVAAGLSLTVDGAPVALGPARASVAEPAAVRAGTGGLSVRAGAALALRPGEAQEVALTVAFGEFAHDWFVQPFLHPDLVAAFPAPELERSPEGDRVTVRLEP